MESFFYNYLFFLHVLICHKFYVMVYLTNF